MSRQPGEEMSRDRQVKREREAITYETVAKREYEAGTSSCKSCSQQAAVGARASNGASEFTGHRGTV
jgi:hypothetical protein